MLLSEVTVTAGAVWGGLWLWGHDHGGWAVAAWLFAAAMVASVVSTAITDEKPFKELLGPLVGASVGAAYLLGLGWFVWGLHAGGSDGAAVLTAIVGLWGVPIALAVVVNRIRGE